MKKWLSYLIPQKVAEYRTSYNAYVRINDEAGRMKLLVNGSPQSGPYIDTLWDAALGAFGIPLYKNIQKILVLGVAGGTVIEKLHWHFPKASITGIEIDPVMIVIGKTYFHLDRITQLQVKHGDAKRFVEQEAMKKHQYDLVIVDMSFGRVLPPFITSTAFIKNIRKLVPTRGAVVVNFLREMEYQHISDGLQKRLQEVFPVVRDHCIYRNRFFFASIV